MKAKTIVCAAAGAFLALFGCRPSTQPTIGTVQEASEKVLVVYYSWGGNTRAAAEAIHAKTGGDLFEIKITDPYPADYQECLKRAKADISAKARPALSADVENLDSYNVIFVGSPNWYGTMAPPLATFLSSHDFSGKIVIPFFTNGGGGMQNCEHDVQELCPNAQFGKAGTFREGTRKGLAEWLDSVFSPRK